MNHKDCKNPQNGYKARYCTQYFEENHDGTWKAKCLNCGAIFKTDKDGNEVEK